MATVTGEMGVDLAKLTAPFPREAIKQRAAGGGRMLDYVEGHVVIHRLNDATNNCWDMTVRDITSKQVGDGTLMIAHVALTLPGLGTREGLGVQMVHNRGGEDLVKGCVTDGLKKAATLFGVGLELYGPDYENGEMGPESRPAARVAQFSRDPVRDASRPVERPQNGDGGPRPQAGPGQITEPQKKLLNGLLSRKGVEDVPDFLWQRFQEESIEPLTKQQASRAIDELQTWPDRQRVEQPVGQGVFRGMPEPAEPDEDGYVN